MKNVGFRNEELKVKTFSLTITSNDALGEFVHFMSVMFRDLDSQTGNASTREHNMRLILI